MGNDNDITDYTKRDGGTRRSGSTQRRGGIGKIHGTVGQVISNPSEPIHLGEGEVRKNGK